MRPPEVTLAEGRERVGRTADVDPALWWWSADDVRWLARQWRLTVPLDPDPLPVPFREAVRAGAVWFYTGSPRILRVMTALCVIFAYGFGWGWMSA